MDWETAIERNGQALKRILAALIAMTGLAPASSPGQAQAIRTHLPRHLHRAVLRLLRPAESAARRLIVVAARGLTVDLRPIRPRKPKPSPTILRNGKGTGIILPPSVRQAERRPVLRLALPLLDPLRNPTAFRPRRVAPPAAPRILSFGARLAPFAASAPCPPRRPALPNDLIDTTRLALRLEALGRALDDLPSQARRFAGWRARRDAALARERDEAVDGPGPVRFRRISPLRPGRPPGGLRRPTDEVHEVLADLHVFAVRALERPDTS